MEKLGKQIIYDDGSLEPRKHEINNVTLSHWP